jgi:hypothetical protein
MLRERSGVSFVEIYFFLRLLFYAVSVIGAVIFAVGWYYVSSHKPKQTNPANRQLTTTCEKQLTGDDPSRTKAPIRPGTYAYDGTSPDGNATWYHVVGAKPGWIQGPQCIEFKTVDVKHGPIRAACSLEVRVGTDKKSEQRDVSDLSNPTDFQPDGWQIMRDRVTGVTVWAHKRDVDQRLQYPGCRGSR